VGKHEKLKEVTRKKESPKTLSKKERVKLCHKTII